MNHRIGFMGLGIMGASMAANAAKVMNGMADMMNQMKGLINDMPPNKMKCMSEMMQDKMSGML